jgi:hypothetical protein
MKKIIVVLCMLSIMLSTVFAATSSSDPTSTTLLSISVVNQDPDPAAAGDVVEVRLGIENLGGAPYENLMMEFAAEYPFSLVTGENALQNIGTINSYQTTANIKIIKYKIRVDKDANAGSYELKVRYYKSGSTARIEKSLSVDISNTESAEVIYIDKSVLIPGHEDTLKFTITNVGNAPLRDLTFSWTNADKIVLPVGSDNTKYIKYINVGDSAELEYNVIADTNADAGLYELSLLLTYNDPLSTTEKEISTIAGIYVGGGTDFDIAFSETSSGTTSFTIANIGSNPAFSVSVIVPEQQGWSISGTNSMIIGNLNTGDYTVASFTLQSSQASQQMAPNRSFQRNSSSAQSRKTLKMNIAYTDTMGKRELVEKEISMSQQTSATTTTTTTGTQTGGDFASFRQGVRRQSFFSKYKTYIIVVVVLAVLITFGLFFRRYKKEKHLNPHFRFKDLFHKNKRKK